MAKNVAVVKKRSVESRALTEAKRALTPVQRLAMQALLVSATPGEAIALLAEHGVVVERSTLNKWLRNDRFFRAMTLAEQDFTKRITRDNVLRKTEAVLEKAIAGTPIVGEVGDNLEIVGYKADLPTAARLLELQGRAVGAFQDDRAAQIAVMIDIDFSGRKDAPPVIDAEIIETYKRDELAETDAEIRRREAAELLAALDDDDVRPPGMLPREDAWLG